MKNKLYVIGFIGIKKCYMNIPKQEAIERYCKENDLDAATFDEESVDEVEFDDEFEAYDVWEFVKS